VFKHEKQRNQREKWEFWRTLTSPRARYVDCVQNSRDQWFQAPNILWFIQPECDYGGQLTGNAGDEYICFSGLMVAGLSPCDAHIALEMLNDTFHGSADFVQSAPFVGITLYAGEHTEIHIFVCIGCTPALGVGAGISAFADPFAFDHTHFGAAPFMSVGTP
jgi:hypothetical protein